MGTLSDRAILDRFPKQRPALPTRFQSIFEDEYRRSREAKSTLSAIVHNLESWMHRRVANRGDGSVLELGAGTLNHLKYEPDLSSYDIVEPKTYLYQNSCEAARIRNSYSLVSEVPLSNKYDRIISVAVLEHLTNLPVDVAHSCLRLKDGGSFQAGIPCEGEFAWYIGWRLTTGLSLYLRHRLDYGDFMRHEHVNTLKEIVSVLNLFFTDVRLIRSPYPAPSSQFSLYTSVTSHHPKKRARQTISGGRALSKVW